MRLVGQGHRLAATCYLGIDVLEDGRKLGNECLAPFIDDGSRLGHSLFEKTHHLDVGLLFLQQDVALRECLLVADELQEILLVELRDGHVHEATSLVASSPDEFSIRGRNHHQRDDAHVLRGALVGLPAQLHLLASATLQPAEHLLRVALLRLVPPLHDGIVGLVPDDLCVDGIRGAPAERQVVDGVQQVGLPHAVAPNQAVHLRGERQVRLFDVFIVDDCQFL